MCLPRHVRRPGLAVGSLSLNLSNIASTSTPLGLEQALAALLPAVVLQRLTLPSLNDKDRAMYVRGSDTGVAAGRLQLPANTLVVVDEASMGEGTLNEQGVRNLRALANVLQSHTLAYQFPYSEMDLETDLNVVVLSTGKSMLPVDVQVPVQTKSGGGLDLGDAVLGAPSPSTLLAWRSYLLTHRDGQATIPESMSTPVQDYFVQRRQTGPRQAFTEVDLQRCIGLAKLVAVAAGHEELTKEDWTHAVELDEARAARLAP